MATLWTLCCERWSFSFRTKITFSDFRDDFGKKLEGKFTADYVAPYHIDYELSGYTVYILCIYIYCPVYKLYGLYGLDMNRWRNLNAGVKTAEESHHHQSRGNHKRRKAIFLIMDLFESWSFLWRCHVVSLYQIILCGPVQLLHLDYSTWFESLRSHYWR